jgi:parvulin-like peptidyl-prolyl isomerase
MAWALALSAGAQAQMDAYGVAAKVNGVPIANRTLELSFQEYLKESGRNIGAIRYPEVVKNMKRETLDLLVEQELVWQAAREAGVVATEEEVSQAVDSTRTAFASEEAFLRKLAVEGYTPESYREHMRHLVTAKKYLDGVSNAVEVSDEEVHAFYLENSDKMRTPETVRARHILIKLPGNADDAARRAVREKLEGIREQAQSGADFAALARQYSEDATAADGGDLGYFPRGRMVKSFEEAAFALQPGETSDIVETAFGLHLIKVEDHRMATQVPEDLARAQIREHLNARKGEQAVQEKILDLRADADIEILAPL